MHRAHRIHCRAIHAKDPSIESKRPDRTRKIWSTINKGREAEGGLTSYGRPMSSPESPINAPHWLVERLQSAAESQRVPSLILDCPCQGVDLHSIAMNLADYLNEFDSTSHPNWHSLSHHQLSNLKAQWELLQFPDLSRAPFTDIPATSETDLAWNLCQLGGVILEGRYDFGADADLRSCFEVCLCCHTPGPSHLAHIWINPSRIAPTTLVTIIADSFLNWSSANDRPVACAS